HRVVQGRPRVEPPAEPRRPGALGAAPPRRAEVGDPMRVAVVLLALFALTACDGNTPAGPIIQTGNGDIANTGSGSVVGPGGCAQSGGPGSSCTPVAPAPIVPVVIQPAASTPAS